MRRVSLTAEIKRLGLTADVVAQMRLDLRAAIARNNNDLLHSFRKGA